MRWKFLLGAIVLVLGLYLIVSPSFKQKTPDLIGDLTPVEVLQEVNRAKDLKSYKYRAKVSGGNNISMNLTGKAKVDREEQLADFSWEGPQGYGEASAYLKGNKVLVFHPLKNRWLAAEDEPALKPLISMAVNQLTLLDPYRSLQRINLNESEIENTGAEEFRGLDTTVIEVKPGAKATNWFQKMLPPQLIGAKISEVKQIYWIGNQDLRIHKYLMTAKIKLLALQLFEIQVLSTVEDHNKTELNLSKALQEKIDQEGL